MLYHPPSILAPNFGSYFFTYKSHTSKIAVPKYSTAMSTADRETAIENLDRDRPRPRDRDRDRDRDPTSGKSLYKGSVGQKRDFYPFSSERFRKFNLKK